MVNSEYADVAAPDADVRFRTIVESAAIGIALVAPAGELEHVNPRLCEMIGYTRAQLVGKTIVDITHPDDLTIDLALREQLMLGVRDAYQIEKRYVRADGSLLWGKLSVSVVRRADGSVEHVILMVEDTTELRRLNHAIGERIKELNAFYALSRRLLRAGKDSLQDLLQDIADLLPPAFQFPDITQARVRIGTLEARTAGFVAGHPTLRAGWDADDTPPGSIEVQYTAVVPQAAEGPFLAEERAMIDSLADLLLLATVGIREAAERDLAEQALRESEDRLQVALDAARMGTIEWDLRNETAQISEVTRQIFDFPVGTKSVTIPEFRARIHPEHRDQVRQFFRAELAGREGRELEYRLLLPDGVVRWVSVRARVFFNEDGVAQRRAGAIVDVTSRRLFEDAFRHAQKMEAVGRLAGGVAHDFNNLLTVIGAAAEFAQLETEPGTQLHADVQDIADAVQRARSLTTQLLTFSRRQVVRPAPLDLGQMVRGTDKMLRRLIGADITLTLSSASEVVPVFADAGQMEQVLVNLVVNARDAMPDGGAIEISTGSVTVGEIGAAFTPELHVGKYAVLAVRDTGAGMDEETVARIFEPFFTTKEAGKGTGLGLATAFGIVSQAAGHILVQSEVGTGTTFRIYLPATLVEAAADDGTIATSALAMGGDETILLVEDEPHVRLLARRILVERGYTVLEASGGTEAIELAAARQGALDLLLTDVVLPERNGREVADTVLATRPQLRVLFMSGYTADAGLHSRVTASGAPFIDKPFTRTALASVVRAVLDAPRH